MLFILGIERSATTWVSNLMEAHPSTKVYVEPMSVLTARYKHWPNRFKKITDLNSKAGYFRDEFKLIREHKTWLLTSFSSSAFAWKFDLWFSNWLVRKQMASEAARDFSEVNFHRKAQLKVDKDDQAALEIIKELRLNFNAQIISQIDPNARVLVVVRNVFANIQSILSHIEKGNLIELKSLLLEKDGDITAKSIYAYWRDSYNQLLQKLDEVNTPYMLLDHTELIQNPKSTIREISNLAGLSDIEPILNYFWDSNTEGKGIHNTNRRHEDLLTQNRKAKEEILPQIEDVLVISELYPTLQGIVQNEIT